MAQSYLEFVHEQMIITFADLEGDYDFLIRSLSLYKKIYKETYPDKTLNDEDFTIAGVAPNQYICYPENVVCVNIGDLTDKTRSNTGRTNCYNMHLVRLFNNTHQKNNERMISIHGNRETTKFRLSRELNIEFIEQVLKKEIELPVDKQNITGSTRDPNLIWVDNRAKTFLQYLKNIFNVEDNDQVAQLFAQQSSAEKFIQYAKWMLANSCGAPDLWNDIATEADIKLDDNAAILQTIQNFFCDENSEYIKYLNYTQIGVQIGNILFTHAGVQDHSFTLPKTLFTLVPAKELRQIFEGQYNELALKKDSPIEAKNIHQLLSALNAWYAQINKLRFTSNPSLKKIVASAIDELILMGLPPSHNHGASVVNLPTINAHGAYGIHLCLSTHTKLLDSSATKPIYISYHGHVSDKFPRYATTVNFLMSDPIILQRIDGDTCYTRKNNSAVSIAFHQHQDILLIESQYIDETSQLHILNWPGRTLHGDICNKNENKITLSQPEFYLGAQLEWDGEQGWSIIDYKPNEQLFTLYKLNNVNWSEKIIDVNAFLIVKRLKEHYCEISETYHLQCSSSTFGRKTIEKGSTVISNQDPLNQVTLR